MLDTKFKAGTKYRVDDKIAQVHSRISKEDICISKQKNDLKNYMNEIFAGLIWLG